MQFSFENNCRDPRLLRRNEMKYCDLPYPPSSFPGFSPTQRSSAESLMCQIFFQFDWQTGDNIIFNRPIIGLTPILVHSWGPEQGFRVCSTQKRKF